MRVCLAAILVLASVAAGQAQTPFTPKAGSTERQAICDAARVHLLGKYATRPLPQPIVFKIDRLSVAGSYANLQAVPLLNDGSYAAPAYVPDIAFNFCLKKAASGWAVIADLSRSDVPDRADVASIRRQLPEDFPLSLFSPTWRKLLAEH